MERFELMCLMAEKQFGKFVNENKKDRSGLEFVEIDNVKFNKPNLEWLLKNCLGGVLDFNFDDVNLFNEIYYENKLNHNDFMYRISWLEFLLLGVMYAYHDSVWNFEKQEWIKVKTINE